MKIIKMAVLFAFTAAAAARYYLWMQGLVLPAPLIELLININVGANFMGYYSWIWKILSFITGVSRNAYLLMSMAAWGTAAVCLFVLTTRWKIKGMLTGIVLLPWWLWAGVAFPIDFMLLVALFYVSRIKVWGRKERLVVVVVSLLSFPATIAVLIEVISRKQERKIALIVGMLLLIVGINVGSALFKERFEGKALAEEINIQAGSEYVAVGRNLVPLPFKRLALNKVILGARRMAQQGINSLDLEAAFFAYNMQQGVVWKEGLTEKQVFMGLDFVVLALLIVGVIKKNQKKEAMLLVGGLVFAGIIWPKQYWNYFFLLSLPVITNGVLAGIETSLINKRVIPFLTYFLVISVWFRMDLLLNKEQVWIDNRNLAYQQISQAIKGKEGKVTVSSRFGSAQKYVGFYKELSGEEFGELPKEAVDSWPSGIYAGLADDFSDLESAGGVRVIREYELRDEIVKKAANKILVIEKY